MNHLTSYERQRTYKSLVDIETPWGGSLLVLWSSPSVSDGLESDKMQEKRNTSDKQTYEKRIKKWICKRTSRTPGKGTSFQDLYRSYCLSTLCKGRVIMNESRFSKLVIQAYEEKGLKVERRRSDNRVYFTDLTLLNFPKPFLLVCGQCFSN